MTLSADQDIILTILARHELANKFYWTGGTLLSHQYLHHRKSFDLDFFSDTFFGYEELTPFLDDVKRTLGGTMTESRIYDRWEFVVKKSDREIRLEFVHYNHEKKRLAPLIQINGILIDSLPDLAANKTMAYVDRNEVKDLFDIYTLLIQKKFSVAELLLLVEKKFGAQWGEFLFWSESAKSLKNISKLRIYLLEQDPAKQDELLKDLEHFFLDGGRDFLAKQLG